MLNLRLNGVLAPSTRLAISNSTLDDDKPSYFSRKVLLHVHQIICRITKLGGHPAGDLLEYSRHDIRVEELFK